ncbi:MAG TPA: calcium-binding protein [Rhodopila sp.]|jgi:Ca2+-binding RTX toxin-like protein|nr:calcium-binding protein [Rhodopila sp.]
MVSSVTVGGSGNPTATISFDSQYNLALAERIAAQINAGIGAGTIVTAYDTQGSPPPLPAGVSGVLVQSRSELMVMPRGYTTDLVTKPGTAIVFGSGAPDETILSDKKTDLTFIAVGGSGTVVAGGGDNRLAVGGSGNWSLYTGGGDDIIAALGAVNATIGAGGGDNSILLGNGSDLVISTGDDTISGGSGAETVDATGARRDFVQGDASHLLFIGGAGGATILGGTGSDTYLGSAGSTGKQVIVGGSAGNNFLFAGAGAATLVGGGNNDQLLAYGNAAQLLVAASGNETLSAALSSGNDTLRAGAGRDLLIGGTGADTFIGGSGHSTVTAGTGRQVFTFINHEAGGTELVQGMFDPADIRIDLQGYGHDAINRALASQTVANGSVTISLIDGTKVTFQDVASLNRSNFIS